MPVKVTKNLDNITLDMGGTSIDRTPVAAADYSATFTDYLIGLSAAGQPKVDFTWTLSDNDQIEGEENVNGRKAWRTYSLQGHALFGIKRALVAMGVDPTDLGGKMTVKQLKATLNELKGVPCTVRARIEEYQGEPRNRWEVVMPSAAEGWDNDADEAEESEPALATSR